MRAYLHIIGICMLAFRQKTTIMTNSHKNIKDIKLPCGVQKALVPCRCITWGFLV